MRREFTHFEPEGIMIPASERGELPPEGTQVVVGHDGTIACVGTADDVAAWVRTRRSEGAEVSVEQGGVLLPGLTDTHYHPGIYSSIGLMDPLDVSDADSPRAFARMVQEGVHTKELRHGQPLVVLDYDSGKVGSLNRVNLDEVEDTRPMFVMDRSFHGGSANTRGAELLRGYLERTYGKRTFPGRFRGRNFSETYVLLALELAESFGDVRELQESMEGDINGYLAKGVTASHELITTTWNQFMAYLLLRKEWGAKHEGREFPVRRLFLDERVLARLTKEQNDLVRSGLFDQELAGILGVKFFADGAFGSHTAHMSEAYHDCGKFGITVTRMHEAERAMGEVLRLGLNKVAVHAIGDKGIARAIEMAKRWRTIAEDRGVTPEFRFEHFELPLGETVSQARDLGAWVSMQSNFGVEDQIYTDRLGDRARLVCPHADLATEGVPMMLGSDGMPKSMLYVVWSAMHHPDPRQRLDLISAITAASAAAGAYEQGNLRGVLQKGAKTEIVVATPEILNAFADGSLADEYIADALKPRAERRQVPIRDQVGRLEREILKVFAEGQIVYDATKEA